MSEQPEQMDQIDADAVASLDPDEVSYDQDLALGEDGEEDVAQRSYVPNDRPLAAGRHGTTAREQHDGSSVEERVAAEVPDVDGARPGDEVLPDDQPSTDALGEDVSAEDVGIDGGAASAEEAAMHVVADPRT